MDSNENCSICLELMDTKFITTNCGHKFHTDCYYKTLQYTTTCPLCRQIPQGTNIISTGYGKPIRIILPLELSICSK